MIKQRLMGRVGVAGIAASIVCGAFLAGCSKDAPGPAGAGGEPREPVGVLGIEAPPVPVPPEQRAAVQTAVKWLKQAVAKVESVEQQHHRYEFALITDAARGHCGGEALDVVRAILAAIEKTPLPSDENVLHARLAATVVQYDVVLCEELLRQAIADGRRAADTKELWEPRVDVAVFLRPTRAEREGWRRLLQFRIELWECALLLKSDPPGAERRLRTLLETARKAGCTPGDAIQSYEDWLLDELARLTPRVVLAIWPGDRGDEALAEFCYHQAYRRHTNGMRDSVTAFFARSAAERGFVPDRPQNPLAEYRRWVGLRPPEPETVDDSTRLPVERLLRDAAARPPLPIDPEPVRALFRNRTLEELAEKPDVDWKLLSYATRVLPADERLPLLQECLEHEGRTWPAGGVIQAIFETDHDAGMKALDEFMPLWHALADYHALGTCIARVSPAGYLKVYRAVPGEKKLNRLDDLRVLAEADADFALSEASRLPGDERNIGVAWVAVGIARTDLTRARELVEPLPEKVRERVEFDGQENYLVGHPADSEMITGEYRTRILPQAAWRIHRERGMEGVEELLSSLTDPGEKGTVLWKIAEKLVLSNEPELAESLLERIEAPYLFIAASCSLSQSLVELHRREAF